MAWWHRCAVGVLVVATACSGTDDTSSDTASTTSSIPSSDTASAAAPSALDFTAPAVGGGTVDLRAYAGTTVALWFWAPY